MNKTGNTPAVNASREIDLTKINDAGKLRVIMSNAERLNRKDVYWKAFKRLCSLEGFSESDPLHRDSAQVIAAYEELLTLKNRRTTRATRTRQKIANKGLEQAIEEWALMPTSPGFELLMENDMPELTFEHLAVKYSDRFSKKAVAAAEEKLGRWAK